MRKVYHHEKRGGSLALALFLSLGFTALLFGFIPFAHRVNKPGGVFELAPASVVELPPPVEEESRPPEVEEQKPPEAPPEPQLTEVLQQIPLVADLEVAVGAGGPLTGFGESIRALTAVDSAVPEAFSGSDLEKQPQVVSQILPNYPSELRKAKIDGVATLLFVIGEDGKVEDARVESSSRVEFEKPALDAIRKWRFRPGEKDGKPVRSFHSVPMRFRVTSG